MKIKDFIDTLDFYELLGDIDFEREVTPTYRSEAAGEHSLLFILPKVSGGYSIAESPIPPYAIVTDENYDIAKGLGKGRIIRVKNIRRALSIAFAEHYGFTNEGIDLIAVTGTNGKTTTATLIYNILRASGVKAGLIGTGSVRIGEKELNSSDYTMTTPDPDLLYLYLAEMKKVGCRAVVMEVSSHAIALEKVAMLKFKIGVFTNLSEEHLDFHKDMEDYFEVKSRLFKACDTAIICIDDEYGKRLYSDNKEKAHSVGIINKGEIYATDVEVNGTDGIEYYYRTNKIIFRLRSKLIGAFNIYNTMLAIAAAILYGVRPCVAKEALRSQEYVRGRAEIISHSPLVIIDYAHTPFALKNLLVSLKSKLNIKQKLICVIGCGGERDKSKRSDIGIIATEWCDYTVITEDNSRGEEPEKIFLDITKNLSPDKKYEVVPSRLDAIQRAIMLATDDDVVAIVGKGHEDYIIDKSGKRHFDEREIVKRVLSCRRGEICE